MNRQEALELIRSKVKNPRLIKHMLATEAVMRALANHLGEDEELWGLAGLLHDVDYDQTAKDPCRHGLMGAEWLEKLGIDNRILQAIRSHPGHIPPSQEWTGPFMRWTPLLDSSWPPHLCIRPAAYRG